MKLSESFYWLLKNLILNFGMFLAPRSKVISELRWLNTQKHIFIENSAIFGHTFMNNIMTHPNFSKNYNSNQSNNVFLFFTSCWNTLYRMFHVTLFMWHCSCEGDRMINLVNTRVTALNIHYGDDLSFNSPNNNFRWLVSPTLAVHSNYRTVTPGDSTVEPENTDPRPPMAIFELLNYIVNEVQRCKII